MPDRIPSPNDPFAERARPWWRRLLVGGKQTYAPKRYARVAATLGPVVAFLVPAHHRPVVIVLVGALFVLPSMLVEAWFRQRARRRDEQILP